MKSAASREKHRTRFSGKLDRWVLLGIGATTAIALLVATSWPWVDCVGLLIIGPLVVSARRGAWPTALVGLYALLVAVPLVLASEGVLFARHSSDETMLLVAGAAVTWVAGTRQKALQAKDRLAAILDSSHDAVVTADRHGFVTDWSRAAEALFGYTASEMVGRTPEVLVPADRQDELPKIREHAAAGMPLENLETVRVTKDGRRINVTIQLSPIHDGGGRVIGASCLVRETTQWRRAQEAVRSQEAVLRGLYDSAPMMMGVFELVDGDVLHISGNAAAARFLGRRPGEEDLLRASELALPPETIDAWVGHALESEKLGGPVRFEHSRATDGETKWLSVTVCPVSPGHGSASGPRFAYVAEDVSEVKLLEEQFRQSQKMEAVGVLAGGIAHDFNNLLTVISGYSDIVLKHIPRTDRMHENVQEIKQASKHAADLTRQLLAFSRRQVLKPQVLDLNQVVRDTKNMLERVIGEDVCLEMRLAPVLGPVLVDPGQIEQVLLNLAVNSRDAMPSGGRLVLETGTVELDESYCRRHPEASRGTHVVLAVTDTGQGMDPQILGRIFEPFFTTKDPGRGTGLGLSTVYGIVKQSGGSIRVHSEPGAGATFKIYLPRASALSETIVPGPPSAGDGRGSELVLLVEDNELVRRLVREMLASLGYSVLEACDGDEALRIAEAHPRALDALIADVVMPGMSGPKLAAALAAGQPQMKVLYMSGYAGDAIAQQGALDPRIELLEKPFSGTEVARRLRTLLDARDPEPARK